MAQYNLNIVETESGVKHHQTNKQTILILSQSLSNVF